MAPFWWDCPSLLNWISFDFKKIGTLIYFTNFIYSEVAPLLYKSTIWPYLIYYYHICAVAPRWYTLECSKIKKSLCRTVIPTLAASFECSGYHQNLTNLSHFYRHYFDGCSSKLASLIPLLFSCGNPTCYSIRFHNSVTILSYYKDAHVKSFFPGIDSPRNLPPACFPQPIIKWLKSRPNRHQA